MDKDEIVRRITELEEELRTLKSAVVPPPKRLAWIRGIPGFLLSYWVLLSFVVAVATAVYVKYAFRIDYFEQYRDLSAKKEISELHRKLGERLMARSEWEAAVIAYTDALKVNPNNLAATVGLVQAQVFLPYANQKFAVPEIIDVKLQYLKELDTADPYIVHFLEGVRDNSIGDYSAARVSLEKSIEANPRFAGGYVQLGYMQQKLFNLDGAIESYTKALQLDPQHPTALNNLGYMNLLAGRYDEAVKRFRQSDSIAPRMLTGLNLGEAYRYQGDYRSATAVHEIVLKNAKRLSPDDESYGGGEWLYNFLPLKKDDTQTIKRYIVAETADRKLAIAHFALALDYAVDNRISEASSELKEAERLESGGAFRAFYVNRIVFLRNFPDLETQPREWLTQQGLRLASQK
jgi:tetratricopeptide (TPR) repeat protein